jgi:hypothetical protein
MFSKEHSVSENTVLTVLLIIRSNDYSWPHSFCVTSLSLVHFISHAGYSTVNVLLLRSL